MNFLNWIREGVRHAVLLGVSEAVEDIGASPNGEDMGQKLLEVIRRGGPQQVAAGGGGAAIAIQARRKKLGRSLNDIQSSADRES